MPKLKMEVKLARVFATVADTGQQLESTAGEILALVQSAKITTIATWNKLVKAAYAANGWNESAGRPTKKRLPVPPTVSQYVALVRQAIRKKLRLGKYESFTQLRVALARSNGKTDHRGGRASGGARIPKDLRENFRGVPIANHTETNGALFHDIAAIFIHLPTDHRSMFGRQLNQLMAKYAPLAKGLKHPTPALPAPAEAEPAAATNGHGEARRKAA